ncbi:hypothetical protein ACSBOB_00770 [Mesorhizobium sp. ASY16-5R]|uniref:hypothetical protein n=1 Tax=Mesorhizobium sp. ASY16-5R TaxID=3445772 RepID=UPI003FA08630
MDSPHLFQDIIPPATRPEGDPAPLGTVDETAPDTADRFDWNSDDSVLIGEQLATAVYRNRAGGIVIRQEARSFDEDDNFIVLRDAEAVRLVIKALRREAEGGA